MTVPPTTDVDDDFHSASPWLVEFGRLWGRGLADAGRVWSVFEASELYIERPEYFGAPLMPYRGALVSPVFSTVSRLAEFRELRGEHSRANGPVDEWVHLRGADFLVLPIRARFLVIDPGAPDESVVDLTDWPRSAVLAHGASPALIDLELDSEGCLVAPAEFRALVNELSGGAS